ncbi:MAG: succinylglutamate desuccinylase/aspartoacylase family protein [Chloroflexi bacterium]|nr:succinylglutamate desuccinylase/aspartoacylase family protein [Chloroflexota bacterium]
MTPSTLVFGNLRAEPGTRVAELLPLRFADTDTRLPLFLINGAHDGPTLVVTAGIHGSEYVGIEAAYRLALGVDPAQLRGRLIVAPICSMTAYAKRATYIAPPDTKNLNRCFPGDASGSFAEQLAAWIFENLIRRGDAYLDLHGGDLNEALVPFSIIKRTTDAAVDARSLALAEAFGIAEVVVSEVKGSTVSAASDSGVPAVLAEIGGQGVWSEAEAQRMHDGLLRSLAHLGMLGMPKVAAPARIFEQFGWLRSEHDGLFHPSCKVGDFVRSGQNLGHVADLLGRPVQQAVAPHDGIIMFLVTTLAMNAGDPLLAVGA